MSGVTGNKMKETKLGMTVKKDDKFGEWYSEVRFLAFSWPLPSWRVLLG
jgi:hypothetical protein